MMSSQARRTSRRQIARCLFVLVLISGNNVARSQEAPSAGAPAAATAPATTKPAADRDWERLIYVPYRNLRQVFEKEGAAALMPYGQFLKLFERLQSLDLSGGARAPIQAVITSAGYVGRVEKEFARIDATLAVQVLGEKWSELAISFGEAAIARFADGDGGVLLQGTGNGAYTLLFPKPGAYRLNFELAARVRTSPDGKSIELDAPAAGITSFDLTVPAGDQSIDVQPQGITTDISGDAAQTQIKASLGSTKKIAARWRPRVSAAPVMEVLTSVQNTLEIRVADGLIHTHAALRYQVLRGQLDHLRLAVPLDDKILDVQAPGLKAWRATRENQAQTVTIDLIGGDAKSILVEVFTERSLPEEPFLPAGIDEAGVAHGIHALGEVRESGLVAVTQGSELALAVDQQSGLVRVEAAEVADTLRRPDSLFYRYYTPRFRLLLSARAVEPRLLVEQRTALAFREDETQLTATIAATIERTGVFELRFKLPAGLIIDRVDCEPMKEFQAAEGSDQLVVLLREKTQGRVNLTISGHAPRDASQKDPAPLPLIEPLAAAREDGLVAVYAPDSIEVIADEKQIRCAHPARLDAAQGTVPTGTRLVAAWNYNRRPEIAVRTERKPTRLSAVVATSINLRQEVTEVTTLIQFGVQFAAIDTFRIAVPEAVADSVQIDTTDPAALPIKQKQRAPEAADGWVTWTVVLQRETAGTIPLRVKYDIRADAKEVDRAKPIAVSIQPIRVLSSPGHGEGGAEISPAAVSGEITVLKDRAFSVQATANDLEPIDVRELTLLPADGYLAFRYYRQPAELAAPFALELSAARNEIQPIVETIVEKALVEMVLTEDLSVTYRCRYRLKTSERQRLALDLPHDSEVLDTMVAGRRIELEKGSKAAGSSEWDAYRLNVARSTSADEPFVVALVYRTPFRDTPLRGRGGNLRLPLPRLGGAGDEPGSLAVQQLRTAVWVPREFSLVGVPDGFSAEHPTRLSLARGAIAYTGDTAALDQWFGETAGGLFAFTPAGNAWQYHRLGSAAALELTYWRTAWFTWLLSGAVALAGLVLVRTSWHNRLSIVLAAAFVGALYALTDADQVINVLAAARFGLIAVLLFWIVHALTRPRRPVPVASAGATGLPAPESSVSPPVSPIVPPPPGT